MAGAEEMGDIEQSYEKSRGVKKTSSSLLSVVEISA